jgi:ribonuclease R
MAKQLEGTIKVTGKGVGYFKDPENEKVDFEVAPTEINTALNGDTVRVELTGKEVYGRKQARVLEVLERRKIFFVGTFDEGFMIPDDKRVYRDFFIAPDAASGAKKGDKVQAELLEWPDASKSPKGKVVRIIGHAGEHNAEMLGIVYESGFEVDFPPEVENEAEEQKRKFGEDLPAMLAQALQAGHLKERRDFRETLTFTMDPADAKDFDDALSFKKLTDGKFEVGIHIADVSHFVTPKSALDIEARKRGTSIYLVDRTIPMLPEILSNDLCSLNPNEDKYAFSAVFTMDLEGEISERWFGKTLINSAKRFSYEEGQEVLDKKGGQYFEELDTLNKIAYKLREKKFENGAIEFETDEVKFQLDETGKPVKVFRKVRKDTHKLIEDFMLLANREVATYLHLESKKNTRSAGIYRIHDQPDREKIMNLAAFVKALGFELKNKDGETTADDIKAMLKSVEGTPAEALVKTATIRSMQKAVYSTSNIGHFGLAFEFYTHFTSPIRRYPDLLVHRLLYRYLTKGKIEQDEIAKYQSLAESSTEREIEAAEAERASIKYKQVEYMSERVGQEFEATVSGVSEWGVYVEEVETKADGMVRLKEMTDDFYELDEKQYAVVGKKTGKKYSLGDKVKVKLLSADQDRKTLDFAFV